MNSTPFSQELQARIAKYDLLSHPFYKAWSAGELSRDDLREYACQYYHHVAAFPTYLAQLAMRLEDGELRQAVLANMADEKGLRAGETPHAELWLDFAEGMGASRDLRRRAGSARCTRLMKRPAVTLPFIPRQTSTTHKSGGSSWKSVWSRTRARRRRRWMRLKRRLGHCGVRWTG